MTTLPFAAPAQRERVTSDELFEEGGRTIHCDAKGIEDGEFRIKAKLHRAKFGDVELRLVRRGPAGRLVTEAVR